VALGQTNVHVLDADGRQIVGFDVEVGRDLVALRSTLKQIMPEANVNVEAVGDNVILSGAVQSPLDAQKLIDIAGRMVGDDKKVVNALSIRGKDQVHLKVTIAEIQRSAIKQIGVNLGAVIPGMDLKQNNAFGLGGGEPTSMLVNTLTKGSRSLTSTLKWLESNSLLKTLAEPNLTAISGESAKFLAGGEFPIPTGRDRDGNVQIEFKTFGVSLVFTPVVLSEGRISLKIGTEVSEISSEGAIDLGNLKVPGLKVRRADSTLELPSGGTMVMAGLIQESTKQNISRMPGLGSLPVLGALFRSREYQNSQTELVIMVTPYIVNHMSMNKLVKPTDGLEDSDDANSFLMGRFNKTDQKPTAHPQQMRAYAGPIQHIKD
jgi:pilus assembly protein CpaC